MDRDLSFLRQATNDDLEPLVGYILNAELSETLSINDKFKQHWPNHHQYVDLIEREIRDFGGNTFANAFRILFDRRPISYDEIVHDVADKLDVPYQEDSPISTIEDDILLAVMINAWPKMTEQEREELSSITDVKVDIPCHIPSSVPFIALQAAIRMGGFASYQIAVIIANAVATTLLGHGLRIATNAALTRSLAIFAGPIGWVITGIWTAIDIAGPAYRVTIPCVLQLAMLRHKYCIPAEQRSGILASDTQSLPGHKAPRLGYQDSGRIGYHG